MPVIGEPPHPQVLFLGFEDDDPAYRAMASLVPSARLTDAEDMRALRLLEWDVLVSRRASVAAPGHMHVLALGCQDLGMASTNNMAMNVMYRDSQASVILNVTDDLPDELGRLVLGELVPWLRTQPQRPYLKAPLYESLVGPVVPNPLASPPARAFVRDADGKMIAGDFERSGGGTVGGRCWALPFVPERPEQWLAAALVDWHERTPQRVPALPGWKTRPTWLTAAEVLAQDALNALRNERSTLSAELEARERELAAAAIDAESAADRGPRRLLTAQGDELVAAVTEALEVLGFLVTNMDEKAVLRPGTPKVEDLRLTDPAEPTWTNITEVRGYTGGAKVSDLQRLGRFAALYQVSTGSLPVSRWYVVNQFLEKDPDLRADPLAGSEEDVRVFAEDRGLVVDSRQLFLLRRRVVDGVVTPEEARALLRRRVGVFVLSPEAEPGSPRP